DDDVTFGRMVEELLGDGEHRGESGTASQAEDRTIRRRLSVGLAVGALDPEFGADVESFEQPGGGRPAWFGTDEELQYRRVLVAGPAGHRIGPPHSVGELEEHELAGQIPQPPVDVNDESGSVSTQHLSLGQPAG